MSATPVTPAPTAVPTLAAVPDSTARQSVTLAAPAEWGRAAESAVEALNAESAGAIWQLALAPDPAALLAGDGAQAAMVPGGGGLVIAQRPIALAVPFTTDWEGVTRAEAEAIAAEGHPLVTVTAWEAMPPTHKALRVDGLLPFEAGYPLQSDWSLAAAPGYEAAAAELAPALRAATQPEPVVHLAAVGDLALDRDLGDALQRDDLTFPFAHVSDRLAAADITFGNLESALGDGGQPADKGYAFRAPPQAAEALSLAGFDVLSLANNHALDYGPEALLQGLALLHGQDIGTVGAGGDAAAARAPLVVPVKGLRVAFLAYVNVPLEASDFEPGDWIASEDRAGVAWALPADIRADVSAARAQADLVIVSLHSGVEFQAAPGEAQMAAARTAIDAGANLVVGHHTHVLQGIAFYKQGVIAYGLGNFAFGMTGVHESAILNVWLDPDGVRQLEVVPVLIPLSGQPRLATEEEGASIRRRVYLLTEGLSSQRPEGNP